MWRVGDTLGNPYSGDNFYVPVNTRYGVAEIKEDCVGEDTTGLMFCKLGKSVCEKVQTNYDRVQGTRP